MKVIRKLPLEAIIWSIALLGLAYLDADGHHVSICPLAASGFDFCPGCGLGRSISLLFHGELLRSIRMHPLGIFALIILLYRIFQLIKFQFKLYGKSDQLPT